MAGASLNDLALFMFALDLPECAVLYDNRYLHERFASSMFMKVKTAAPWARPLYLYR